MTEGTVTRLNFDGGFGFIEPRVGPDVFFRFDVLDGTLTFDENLRGQRVRYEVTQAERGPRATRVSRAS